MKWIRELLMLAVVLVVASGCAFNRAWKRAATAPIPASDITGRWEGTWVSDVNHHHGRLRCLLSRDDAGACQARFHATFWGIFRVSYSVPLQAAPADGQFKLQGERDLGWLAGGVYTYEGTANSTNFFCTYHCESDHGTFRMTRPK